eukprot:TRINITY_DN483_c0_g1_i2.p1 TRINITY_DN483_c0_g1~~TRINITY_DN483_c0_g1_i2.p1  ORF type:complete len:294 (-),score=48.78 TRINITY_DN483_c0_g1_i2:93-974(-)
MLCEVQQFGNFFSTWIILSLMGVVLVFLMSGTLFYIYYVKVTYEKWRYKINPEFPSPAKVKQEIIFMLKGILAATLCPTISLYLSTKGMSNTYCGVEPHGWTYLILQTILAILFIDFFEFYYHRMGHTMDRFWNFHKSHHIFFNPSPFAVIADEYVDQFVRASPLLFLPLLFPINMDVLFFTFGGLFYAYGVYLHWGYEVDIIDAHHPILNTSFQHFAHHAKSIKNEPYHTGFFFKIWDNIYGSVYPAGKCFCSKCEREKGNRSKEHYDKILKPDYSVLLNPSFWLNGSPKEN